MAGVSDEYKREKILDWKANWDPNTIGSWSGNQLEQIYRRVQQEIVTGIEQNFIDYRVIRK